jgi:hypothetical protein
MSMLRSLMTVSAFTRSTGRMHAYGQIHEACTQLWNRGRTRQVKNDPQVAALSTAGGPLAGRFLLVRVPSRREYFKEDEMATHVFMVLTKHPDGASEDYHRWYEDRHMPDVLAVPGFVSAQRFSLAPEPDDPAKRPRFLSIYEIETNDASAVMAELQRRAGTDQMPLYPNTEVSQSQSFLGKAMTPKLQT